MGRKRIFHWQRKVSFHVVVVVIVVVSFSHHFISKYLHMKTHKVSRTNSENVLAIVVGCPLLTDTPKKKERKVKRVSCNHAIEQHLFHILQTRVTSGDTKRVTSSMDQRLIKWIENETLFNGIDNPVFVKQYFLFSFQICIHPWNLNIPFSRFPF